jgi:hypothetical protein
MDIDRIRQILNRIPSRTDYEFRNFELESQGSWHRQMRYAMRQKESITDQIDRLAAEIDLANFSLNNIKDLEERSIRKRIVTADVNELSRAKSDLAQQLLQIDAWLATYDDSELEDVVVGLEPNEGENWAELLGREVGVEVLSDKQASKSSLMQLSLLPLADYKKSVLITNQFAGFLKKTAEQAEASVLPNRPASLPTAVDAVPKNVSTDLPDSNKKKKKKKT